MDILNEYNKLKELKDDSKYPFNIINNLKHNILETKKEIDLEYIKNFKKDLDILQHKDKISGGTIQKEILIYLY
jgi:hypothetical protein